MHDSPRERGRSRGRLHDRRFRRGRARTDPVGRRRARRARLRGMGACPHDDRASSHGHVATGVQRACRALRVAQAAASAARSARGAAPACTAHGRSRAQVVARDTPFALDAPKYRAWLGRSPASTFSGTARHRGDGPTRNRAKRAGGSAQESTARAQAPSGHRCRYAGCDQPARDIGPRLCHRYRRQGSRSDYEYVARLGAAHPRTPRER